jgi:pilus assembly protein Flp/PilA
MATSFASLVKRFAREERGATMIEYGVLIALITTALVVTVASVGDNIAQRWTDLLATLNANKV